MSTGAIIILVVVVVLALAAGAWYMSQQGRRSRLRRRFGPEYDHRMSETGDRMVAERELMALEKRHAEFKLRSLTDAERTHYAEQWTVLQEQFVDRPGEAVGAAEQLVHTVMRDRGYPSGKFEQQAADLSVEHAPAVSHYRRGHGIHLSHQAGGVSTEELRQALTHYRAIFMSLTGIRDDPPEARTIGDDSVGQHATRADNSMAPHATRAGVDPNADANGTRPVADEPRRHR